MFISIGELEKRLGASQSDIVSAAKGSRKVSLNKDGTKVKPLLEPKRLTLMFRDVPETVRKSV
jgi:hypothetical protein